MFNSKLDGWSWVLIYAGLLGLCLGWFMLPQGPALGGSLMTAGGIAAALGVGLIFVRSRMRP